MNSRRHTLAGCVAVALATSLAPTVVQADSSDSSTANELETVNVSALPLGSGSPSTPYSVMDQQTLTQKNAATLGETLNNQPGVHSDTFGGGASRPVVRGQSGPRVGVLNDGSAVLDASKISPDHTVTVDPMLARQIEVLRGPSTLLYGSGASGGVVNVLDSRIPTERPREDVEGFVGARANTVADENATAAGITFSATDHLVFRVEGSRRDADDYEVDGFDRLTVPGTYAESDNSSIGASWIGDQGFFGMAYSYRRDNYGLPGHSHEFEECGVSGSSLACPDEEHDHEHGEEVTPFVDLASRRVDARGNTATPWTASPPSAFAATTPNTATMKSRKARSAPPSATGAATPGWKWNMLPSATGGAWSACSTPTLTLAPWGVKPSCRKPKAGPWPCLRWKSTGSTTNGVSNWAPARSASDCARKTVPAKRYRI